MLAVADDDDDEEDEDYVPEGEEDVDEEYAEEELSDDPDNPGTSKSGKFIASDADSRTH